MKSWTIVGLLLAAVVAIANGMCSFDHIQAKYCRADYVIRAKVTSAPKFEIPDLPEKPTPAVQTPGTRGNARGHNKTKKQLLTDIGPVPIRGQRPEPRLRRSLAPISSGMGRFGYVRFPQYQEIKIKRILKGVGVVEKTNYTIPENQNNTSSYTRYFSRVYINAGYISTGIRLKQGKSYLLAGRIINNKLRISPCDWHDDWESLTYDQLRGLKKDYKLGCKCRVRTCYYPGCEDKNTVQDVCMWKPDSYIPGQDCRVKHSACRAINGRCQWKQNKNLVKCRKDKKASEP